MGEEREKLAGLLAQLEGPREADVSRASTPGGLIRNNESRKGPGMRPRRYDYFGNLPFEVESERERQKNLDEIISHLYVALEAQDFAPGAVYWTRELRSWLGLKFQPTRVQRIKLVKLYYELALAPGIDPPVVERFASMFMVLTKRKHYLQPIVDLTLDWRPLYRELKPFVLPSESGLLQPSFSRRNYRTLTKMCTFAQVYFDPREMPTMLEEFLPYFDTSFTEEAFVVVGLVNLMMPTVPASPPEKHLMPQHYLPTLFHIWSLVNRSRSFDQHFLDLFSRIARDSLLSTNIPWSEYGVFTKEQSELIFTAILRLLEVPVSSASSPYSNTVDGSAGLGIMLERDNRKHPTAHQIARWIVMSLSPACMEYEMDERKGPLRNENQTKPNSILGLLEGLIQAVETFFHPSNGGAWSKMLSQLVYYLADFFVMRWNREESGEMRPDVNRQLNEDIRKHFVLCLRDVVFMGIYSKSSTVLNFSLSTLQSLANLEPNLIIPPALQRIYPSIQGLVEVHRTTSSLRALQVLTRTMVKIPYLRCHVTTLLGLTLPGIDANDLDKTLYTLSFMQSVFYLVPLHDIAKDDPEARGNALAMEWITSEMSQIEEDADEATTWDGDATLEELEQEALILRSSTASLAEFVSSFLGRVFTLLENLPDAARARSASPEENVSNTLPAVFTPFLAALSPELYDLALNKIADFVSNHVIHQARDAMAFICNSLCKVSPDKALKRLVPLLIASIRTEIDENGAASTRNTGNEVLPRDRALVWNVSMLGMSVVHTGKAVLAHKKELVEIAAYMEAKCQGTPAVHVSNFIHHLLLNLTSIYTVDFAPFESDDYERGMSPHTWGMFMNPESLEMKWHVPSPEEIDFAVELFSSQARTAMNALKALIGGTSTVQRDGSGKAWSDEVSRNLVLVRLLIAGMSNLFDGKTQSSTQSLENNVHLRGGDVPMANGHPPEEKDDEASEDLASYGENEVRQTFKYPDGYALKPDDPHYVKIHELRIQLGDLLHDVHQFLIANQEDDLTCFTPLYTAYKSWFIDIGIEKSAHVLDRVTRLYTSDIRPYKISGLRKLYPRALLLKRANVYHLQRLRYNASPRRPTDLEKQLLLDLAQSSVSGYTEVRRNAQNAIESAAKVIIGARSLLIPPIFKAYEDGLATTDFGKIKGGVYSLLLGSISKTVGRDWRQTPQAVKLYLKTCDVDKPSIQKLISGVTIQILDFCRSTERMAILNKEVLQSIAPEDVKLEVEIERKREKVKKYRTAVEKKKSELVNDLVDVTRRAHWKTATRVVAILCSLGFRFETIASENLVDLILAGTIDTHPTLRALFSTAIGSLFTLIANRVMCEHKYENSIMQRYTQIGKMDLTTRPDDPNWTNQYLDGFARPKTDHFIDNYFPGWLVWRNKMSAQKSNMEGELPYDDVERKAVQTMGKSMTRAWFSAFFAYLLQEPRDLSMDRFRVPSALILGHSFALLNQGFTVATFDDIKEELAKTFGDGSDKHQHRATAEILAALIVSTMDLGNEVRSKVWDFCMSYLLKIFQDGLTPENSSYYTVMLRMVLQGRDPRRSWPLVEWLANFRLDMSSNAAFKESAKIYLLNECVLDAGWHFQLEKPILQDFLAHLDHPYKGVREAIGYTLAAIYRTRYHESYKDVPSLMVGQKEASSIGVRPYEVDADFTKTMTGILDDLEKWRHERAPGQQTPSSYTSGGKTVLLWIHSAISSFECTQFVPFFPRLLEQLLHMMDVKDDQELQSLASYVFRAICSVPLRPGEDVDLIAALIRIGTTSPLWHQRSRVLINIQGLYFRRLFLLTPEQQRALFDCVATMLNDPQHEVRQGAMTSLSGMIRCSPLELRDEIVTQLNKRFMKMLRENPLPKKPRGAVAGLRPGSSASSAPSTGTSTPTPEHTKLVLTRHAAVLGLGALVQAFPYASPPPAWIPDVLATLATKANADPGVVGRSVKSILSDFKKTRQDTWHIDLKVFSSEQVEDLEGVLWKSYFA